MTLLKFFLDIICHFAHYITHNILCKYLYNKVFYYIMLTKKQIIEHITNKVINSIINEVRYIDSRGTKYHGKVNKSDWRDEYNQEPIKDNDKIRVFHGCSLKTAVDWALHGTSGMERHPRTYSYENGMNPLGIFVTTDFETAKSFGYDNECMCVVEFTVYGKDLETPVWNNSDSYFGQGTNPMPFNDKEERNAQKQKYNDDALNIKDYEYWNYKEKKMSTLSYDHVRKSDKPAMANNLFNNSEHQALFMGDLNPNMIKRIWINEKDKESGYINSTKSYVPMSVKNFLKKYGEHEFYQDGYADRKNKVTTDKLYKPNEDFKGWQDFCQRDRYFRKYTKEAEQFIKTIEHSNDNFKITVCQFFFPKQIKQAFGEDFFNEYFNPLGQ